MVKICAGCGKEYEANRNRQYCSAECRKAATTKPKQEYMRQYYRAHRETILIQTHKRYQKKKLPPAKKTCAVCGAEYEVKTNRRYCSEECRRTANRENQRQHYRANREAYLLRMKEYRMVHREDIYLKMKKYRWRKGL